MIISTLKALGFAVLVTLVSSVISFGICYVVFAFSSRQQAKRWRERISSNIATQPTATGAKPL